MSFIKPSSLNLKKKTPRQRLPLALISIAKPQSDLVPIGGGFYATPDEPRDPNYERPFASPVSIGEDGLRVAPPVGFELEVVADSCNIGIQYNAVLLFMRLPSFQLVLRNPACISLIEPQIPAPELDNEPFSFPPNPGCDTGLGIFFTASIYFYGSDFNRYKQNSIAIDTFTKTIKKITYPDNTNKVVGTRFNAQSNSYVNVLCDCSFEYETTGYSFRNDVWYSNNYAPNVPQPEVQSQKARYKRYVNTNTGHYSEVLLYKSNDKPDNIWSINPNVFNTSYSDLIDIYGGASLVSSSNQSYTHEHGTDTFISISKRQLIYTCGDWEDAPVSQIAPPPPRNKPPKECCMCCNDQLQRLILKRLGDFPANVPTKLNTGNNKNATTKIDSVGAMLSWLAVNIDAMVGEFPLNIKIEDSDLTQGGNQTIEIKSPNIAETLSEILGLLLIIKTEGGANLKTSLNAMIETGAIRQTVASNYDYLDGIAEYLGFQVKQINKSLPLAFTPGKEKLDEMLEPSTVKYKTIENIDKKDINDSLAPLLEMAARWNAQNFRNLGTINPKGSLRKLLTDGVKIGKEVIDVANLDRVTRANADPNAPTPDLIPESTFDQFLRDAEVQFQNTIGATDIADPWGDDFANRPQLRQIGKTSQGDK